MADIAEPAEFSISDLSSQASGPALETMPEAKAPEPTPEVKSEPAKVETKQPEAKKPEAKVEPKKDDKKPAVDADEDYQSTQDYKNGPAKLRAILDKKAKEAKELKQRVEALSPLETKVAEYEKRIKEIESKPVETKADTALIEKYENEVKALQARIRETDYPRSDEFKEKFVVPLNKRYQKAVSQIAQLTVTENEQSRAATQADFDYIRGLPFGQQRQMARQLFGQDSDVVLSHVNSVAEIQEQAREAIENEKANGELRQKELTLKQQKEQSEYSRILKEGEEQIIKEFSTFKLTDDPKERELFDAAMDFVNQAMTGAANLPLEKRASIAAVHKMKAVGYDIEKYRREAAEAKVASLTEELAKFRQSDPGAGGDKPTVEKTTNEQDLTIDELLKSAPGTWRG